MTVRVYCQAKGLKENQFFSWRREIRKRDQEEAPAQSKLESADFVPLKIVEAATATEAPTQSMQQDTEALEVVAPGGFIIRVRHRTNMNIFAKVIKALEDNNA